MDRRVSVAARESDRGGVALSGVAIIYDTCLGWTGACVSRLGWVLARANESSESITFKICFGAKT